MKKSAFFTHTILLALLISPPSFATGLVQLYQNALGQDAGFQASKAKYRSDKLQKKVGLAQLLPNIALSADYTQNDSTLNTSGTNSVALTMTQPLFDQSKVYQYKQSKALVERANMTFDAAKQDLMLQVAQAYFNVLRAKDSFKLAKTEVLTSRKRWQEAKQKFDVGLSPITDVQEAQAAYDLSKANQIVREGEHQIALESLRTLTGTPVAAVKSLREDFSIPTLQPTSKEQWLKLANANSPDIKQFGFTREVARYNAKAQKAQHLPTLNLVVTSGSQDLGDPLAPDFPDTLAFNLGTFQDSNGDTVNLNAAVPNPFNFEDFAVGGGRNNFSSASIRLAMPIYAGGGIDARKKQSFHQFIESDENLKRIARKVNNDVSTLYLKVKTDFLRINARARTIDSAQSALDATQNGYQEGIRTALDVLQAERALFTSKRDYTHARYDTITDLFQLKRAAGILRESDLSALDLWLK